MSLAENDSQETGLVKRAPDRFFKPATFGTTLPLGVDRNTTARAKVAFSGLKPVDSQFLRKGDGLEMESLKQQLGEKIRELRHKTLRLSAAEAENKVMRENIAMLMREEVRRQEALACRHEALAWIL
jgi:hypothetical protein